MESGTILDVVLGRAEYKKGEQVDGLLLVSIDQLHEDVNITLQCRGVERACKQTKTKALEEEENTLYEKEIDIFKGRLFQGQYKFGFSYKLLDDLSPSLQISRNGVILICEYSNIVQFTSDKGEIELKKTFPVIASIKEGEQLSFTKEIIDSGCCGQGIVGVTAGLMSNLVQDGEKALITLTVNRPGTAQKSRLFVHIDVVEEASFKGNSIKWSYSKTLRSVDRAYEISKREKNTIINLKIPVKYKSDYLHHDGKSLQFKYQIELILGITEEIGRNKIKFCLPIIMPADQRHIEEINFADFSKYVCLPEHVSKVSVFQLENEVLPYKIDHTNLKVQGAPVQRESISASVLYSNPLSMSKSKIFSKDYSHSSTLEGNFKASFVDLSISHATAHFLAPSSPRKGYLVEEQGLSKNKKISTILEESSKDLQVPLLGSMGQSNEASFLDI